MVFNPSGTRTLAEQTLVERLSTELQALDADAALDAPMNAAVRESMMLVAHVAESRVPLQWRSDADARWQWHIVMLHDGGDLECYCSPAIR